VLNGAGGSFHLTAMLMPTLYHIGSTYMLIFLLGLSPWCVHNRVIAPLLAESKPFKATRYTEIQLSPVGLMILRRESGTVIASHGAQAGQPFCHAVQYILPIHIEPLAFVIHVKLGRIVYYLSLLQSLVESARATWMSSKGL
jgi:hypothetical protein